MTYFLGICQLSQLLTVVHVQKADVNTLTADGLTALMLAADANDITILEVDLLFHYLDDE